MLEYLGIKEFVHKVVFLPYKSTLILYTKEEYYNSVLSVSDLFSILVSVKQNKSINVEVVIDEY